MGAVKFAVHTCKPGLLLKESHFGVYTQHNWILFFARRCRERDVALCPPGPQLSLSHSTGGQRGHLCREHFTIFYWTHAFLLDFFFTPFSAFLHQAKDKYFWSYIIKGRCTENALPPHNFSQILFCWRRFVFSYLLHLCSLSITAQE